MELSDSPLHINHSSQQHRAFDSSCNRRSRVRRLNLFDQHAWIEVGAPDYCRSFYSQLHTTCASWRLDQVIYGVIRDIGSNPIQDRIGTLYTDQVRSLVYDRAPGLGNSPAV